MNLLGTAAWVLLVVVALVAVLLFLALRARGGGVLGGGSGRKTVHGGAAGDAALVARIAAKTAVPTTTPDVLEPDDQQLLIILTSRRFREHISEFIGKGDQKSAIRNAIAAFAIPPIRQALLAARWGKQAKRSRVPFPWRREGTKPTEAFVKALAAAVTIFALEDGETQDRLKDFVRLQILHSHNVTLDTANMLAFNAIQTILDARRGDDDDYLPPARAGPEFQPTFGGPRAVVVVEPRAAEVFPHRAPTQGVVPPAIAVVASEAGLDAAKKAYLAAGRAGRGAAPAGANYPVYVLVTGKPGRGGADDADLLRAVQARLRIAVPGAAPPRGGPPGKRPALPPGARLVRLVTLGEGTSAQVLVEEVAG